MKNITGASINSILKRSLENNLRTPEFQRDFVWKDSQIISLIESAILGLPCGSLVLWSNPGHQNMSMTETFPIRISKFRTKQVDFTEFPHDPKKAGNDPYIIIDGLQRITAIACGFGGLSSKKTSSKYLNGKFFIDMNKESIQGSVVYKSPKQIKENKLDTEEGYKESGLYPLSLFKKPTSKKKLTNHSNIWSDHWFEMRDMIQKTGNKKWIEKAKLIDKTSKDEIMGEMQIDDTVTLAVVAEAFELLNTKGTQVNHVDIIHSSILAWTKNQPSIKKLDLREWIQQTGQNERAHTFGWVEDRKDYKIFCQMVLATELSAKNRKPARDNHQKPSGISVKDQMSLSERHWVDVRKNSKVLYDGISRFQQTVIGKNRFFPYKDCPYPISACAYVGLYYKHVIEGCTWKLDRLDEIFNAFFWKNTLSKRYSVDSLHVIDDMNQMLELLEKTENKANKEWKRLANEWLKENIQGPEKYSKNDLVEFLIGDTRPDGDLKKALMLPVKWMPGESLFNNSNIVYPKDIEERQIHHIFPRKWIKSNSDINTWHTSDKEIINKRKECIANLTPLSSIDNQSWWDSSPAVVIQDYLKEKRHAPSKPIWSERFITQTTHTFLSSSNPVAFLDSRAKNIADWLIKQQKLS